MNKVICFFQQLWVRLKASTPPFFKVLQTVAAVAAFLTGLPMLLQGNGVVLPEYLQFLVSKAAFWSSVIAIIIAKLPTNDPVVIHQFKQQQKPEQKANAA